ncbi:hypothetical protein GCM10020000_49220 [Streptomyces olivoverticillatus]
MAKALGLPDTAVRHSPEVQQMTLTVGGDWRTGTAYPKTQDDETDPSATPSASTSASASDKPDDGKSGDDGKKDPKKKADDNKAPESSDPLNGDDKSACMKVNPLNRF